MKRRDLIRFFAGATIWPLAARAQAQQPVIGFLNADSATAFARPLAAFLDGLAETGYVVSRNVHIEYRWAEGQNDRLPVMAADLVHRRVAVIAATGTPAALAARKVVTDVPMVFETGSDPLQLGLVDSLNRPGGNVTGVTQLIVEVAPKLLEILHELLPNERVFAMLINPTSPALSNPQANLVLNAAHALGVEVQLVKASREEDFEEVFAQLAQLHAAGLMIAADGFFYRQVERLADLTVRHAIPAIYQYREFVAAGGLMSYGSRITDSYHLAGIYTGRILKGDKPADLPVQQATTIEMYINLKTAKALGIAVPLPLSGRADGLFE